VTGAESLDLPAQPPGELEDLAATCLRVAAAAQALGDALRGDRDRLAGCWAGRAASVCDAEIVAVAEVLERLSGPVREVAGLLQAHADEIHEARQAVAALRQEHDEVVVVHRAAVAVVSSAGGLPAPVLRLRVDSAEAEYAAGLASVRARHRAVLERVAAQADRTAARIHAAVADARGAGCVPGADPVGGGCQEARLAALLPLLAAARAVAPPGSLPPRSTSPQRVYAWWQVLTSDEQQRLVLRRTAVLGGSDGVPLRVRAAANELRLVRDVDRLTRRRPRAGRPPWLLGSCLAVVDALAYARAQRDPVTGRPMTASLLVYRPAAFGGQGRVAVAVGDVDRADNVAVLVPGLGSTVGATLRDLTAAAARVTGRARAGWPAESTATIAWTAYDAPNLLQVVGDGAAVAGARLLTADLRGLRAADQRSVHVTVVGHSYGSTTIGTALRAHRAGVDDVVLLGSPGANVERASQLRVPEGNVWVAAASRDPVSYLDRFGADPAHERFGATRFRAEDPARNPVMLGLGDHSRYFTPGSESLDNLVRVVVRETDRVSVAAYRRETAWLPDGIATDPEADRTPADR
jgi:uncharacterized protein YukE